VCLINSAANCKFESSGRISDIFAQVSESCRDLAKYIGLETSSDFPNSSDFFLNSDSSQVMPYIYGVAGVVVPVALITCLLLLYYLLGQLFAWCSCCRPKTSKEVTLKNSIFHILMACLMFVAIALFYFSASEITKGLDSTSDVPVGLESTVDDVFGILNTTVNSSINLVTSTLNTAVNQFQSLLQFLNQKLTQIKEKSDDMEYDLDQAKSKTSDMITAAQNFDIKLDAACGSSNTQINDLKIYSFVSQVDSRIEDLKGSVCSISNNFNDFQSMTSSLQSTLGSLTGQVNSKISDFTNNSLPNMINSLKRETDRFDSFTEPAKYYLGLAEKYSNIVIYCVVGFLTISTIVYTAVYFCTCCCARCLACSFCSFGFIVTLFLGVPSIVFSLLFFLFYDGCPQIDPALTDIGQQMFTNNSNFTELFTCPNDLPDKSLYTLAGLDQYLDYQQIINNLENQLQTSLVNFNNYGTLNHLQSLLNSNNSQFTQNYLVGVNTANLRTSVNNLDSNICPNMQPSDKSDLINYLDLIDSGFGGLQSDVNSGLNNFQATKQFALTIVPKIQNTTTISLNIISNFTLGALNIISTGINSLDCTLICRIYAPAKNAVCVHLVDGYAFWLLSALLMIIGVACMSVSFCQRRKGMLPPQVDDDDEEDDEDSFTVKKEGHHHHHHH